MNVLKIVAITKTYQNTLFYHSYMSANSLATIEHLHMIQPLLYLAITFLSQETLMA